MTPTGLLTDLARRGVRVTADGDQLCLKGPVSVLTDDLQATISAAKPALLELLKSGNEADKRVTEITEIGVSVISVTPVAPHESFGSFCSRIEAALSWDWRSSSQITLTATQQYEQSVAMAAQEAGIQTPTAPRNPARKRQ